MAEVLDATRETLVNLPFMRPWEAHKAMPGTRGRGQNIPPATRAGEEGRGVWIG